MGSTSALDKYIIKHDTLYLRYKLRYRKRVTELLYLDLRGSQLNGTLPHAMVNCRMLEVLNIRNNEISGSFPFWMETPKLRVLMLNPKRFHGVIPILKAKLQFPKLQILDMSHNEFTGILPNDFFREF